MPDFSAVGESWLILQAAMLDARGRTVSLIRASEQSMKSLITHPVSLLGNFVISLLILTAVSLSPARAIEIPDDDEQDVLIRTTLMTLNDANMTGNYSVLIAKASKQFQTQISAEKLAATFEPFRTNKLFFESIVGADYDSYEKAQVDSEGALVLAGVFKSDDVEVKYRLSLLP